MACAYNVINSHCACIYIRRYAHYVLVITPPGGVLIDLIAVTN